MRLPRALLRAVPTCTLWVSEDYSYRWHFAFWPKWKVSALEVLDA